jgi:hypothetical protein
VILRVASRFFFYVAHLFVAAQEYTKSLIADNGDFGGGNFEAHEAVIVVDKEQDF